MPALNFLDSNSNGQYQTKEKKGIKQFYTYVHLVMLYSIYK